MRFGSRFAAAWFPRAGMNCGSNSIFRNDSVYLDTVVAEQIA
jgi:hypothetical protein